MLALFKESAARLKDAELGTIIPFHLFYDALENFLDHSHRGVIIRAYDNSKINPEHRESDVFIINVLKTLFMIKYVLEIEPNLENITSLMISNIDDDRIALKDRVEEALKVLDSQKLIQKNGSRYIFLTDEEQEIEREIDSQNVEMAEVINKVSEMIFEDIFTEKKYRYPSFNGRYSFSFNQAVDDRPYKANQNYDFGLRIITPWFDSSSDDSTYRNMSVQNKEVLVVLPNDAAFLDEIRVYLKIEKFLRLNTSTQLTKYETIKEAKRVEMRERNANAKLFLTESLKEASIYVNSDTVKTNAKEVTSRINEALGRLVQIVYHKLSYIDAACGEADIRKMLRTSNQISLDLDGGKEVNVHALGDVLGYISDNSKMHMKTSMKSVKDRFMKAPYGFVEDDVHWLIARLFKRGDLSFTVNGTNVSLNNKSDEEIISYITKKAFVEKLLMEERIRVSEKDKKTVRSVMKEVFKAGSVAEDEDTIMKNFQRYAQNTINEMLRLEPLYQAHPYPGRKVLDQGKRLMQSAIQIQAPLEFFQYVSKMSETFYDFADDYEPVKNFFGGEQKEIFTRALEMLAIYDDSKTYIVDRELEDVVREIRGIVGQPQPYKNIPKLPALRDSFVEAYSKVLEREEKPVLDAIDQAKKRVMEVLTAREYAATYKDRYSAQFAEIRTGAERCNNVSALRSYADKAEALKIRLLNEITARDNDIARKKAEEARKRAEEAAKKAEQEGKPAPVVVTDTTTEYKYKKTTNIRIKDITHTASWRVETPEDVDKYMADLKKNLLVELGNTDILNVEF